MSTNDFWSLVEKEKKKKAGFNSGLNIDTTPNGAFGDLVQQYKFKSSPFAYTTEDDDDFAPIKTTVSGKDDEDDGFSIGGIDLSGWFQKGAFEDGFDWDDIPKAILGTAEDAVGDLTAGILGMPEKAIDAVATGHSIWTDIVGLDGVSKKLSDFVSKDLYDENAIAKGAVNLSIVPQFLKLIGAEDEEAVSVLGEKTDSTVQSGGQMLATAALQAAGVPWQVTTAVMSYGTEAEQAFREGATPLEAGISSAVTAGSEVLFESLSGGISFGGKTMDDAITKQIARTVSNKAVRTLLKFGVDFTGEGIEEILTGFFSSIGQKLTYAKEKDWAELFSTQEAFDSFVGGAFMGGFGSGVNAVKGKISGVDPVSGLQADEEAVVKKVYDSRVAKSEANGKKLTEREKAKLYDSILTQMEKGYIKADTIESILGGESYGAFKSEIDTFFGSDTYKAYDSARKGEESLPELQKKYDALYQMPNGEKSDAQVDEQAELKRQIEAIQNAPKSADLKAQLDTEAVRIRELQSKLSNEVYGRVKDTRLAESFRERERSKQKFTADPAKYENEHARQTVQSIVDSGLGDNTNQFHDTVEFLARMSADKGVVFNLTNNEGVKKDGHYHEGYWTNGYVTADGKITINKESPNSLYTIAGHEITHVLEKAIAKDGSDGSYSKLQQAVFEYAKSKEGLEKFNARLEAAREAYAGKDNTSAEAEVAADLVGEYIFTDYEFISNLSKSDRNVFQRIWDEVKYMAKIAVAGSKEARQFEKAKKMFQRAYNENVKGKAETEADVKLSIRKDIVDVNGAEYDSVVELDKSVSTRVLSEPKRLLNYIKQNFVGLKIPVLDENGNIEIIEFAGEKETTAKKGKSGKRNPVLGELAHTTGDTRKQVVVNALEVIQESVYDPVNSTPESEHGWLDENGWESRKTYVLAKDGNIYEAYLRIAKARDGRNILYGVNLDINNGIAVDESATQKRAAVIAAMPSGGTVAQNDPNVNTWYSFTKDSDGKQLTKAQQEFFKDSKAVDNSGNLLKVYHTTNNDFTVFDKGRKGETTGDYNTYLGFFFADDPSYMGQFPEFENGKTEAYYLNITNPIDMNNISRQAFLDIVEATGGDIQEAAEIYDREYADELKRAKFRGDNSTIMEMSRLLEEMTGEYFDYAEFYNALKPKYEQLMSKGYDGIINSLDGRGFANEYIVLDSNQAKLTTNENPTADPDIRYSLSKDSTGKELSKEQAAFFKDSKIVDEDGNLKVMYHGSPETFTVFDRKKAKSSGYYGKGFYFTDSESHAGQYGNKYEVYLNITTPLQDGTNDITKEQLRKFVEAIADNEDYGIDNYGYGATVDGVTDAVYGKSDFAMLMDINASCVGNMVEAIELFNEVNGTDYNGIIAPTETVAFYPNQIKSVTNSSPTADPDIRYSLTKYTDDEKKAHNQAVLDHFGKTYRWAETGYVLLDGSRLDLSGKHEGAPGGYRTVDHRDIADALGSDYGGDSYSGSLVQFMSEGNIRIIPECDGINLSVKPNKAQEAALSSFVSNARGEVLLDIDDANGSTVVSVEYPRGTSAFKVLADIRGWFDNGIEPQVSSLSQFRDSLTKEGEEPNTYGDYHYYGRDIGYNDPLGEFVPTREDTAPAPAVAPETVSKTETVDDMFPDDLPSIDEELDNLLQQKEALESRMQEALDSEDYDAFAVVNDEYNSLMARLEELEQEAADVDADRLSSLDDAVVPPVRENEWLDRADVVPLTKKAAQDIARDVRQRLALSNKQMYDVHMLIEEYSRSEFPDREQLFRDIKEKFGTYTESEFDETVKEAKNYLRTYGLFVSDSIQKEIADYAHLMRKNRGRIRFSKDGTEVDVLYHELNSLFPHLFPESIIAPTDQFLQMVDVANMDAESKVEQDLPDDAIWDVADAIADSVTRYQQTQKEKDANKYGRESFNSLMRDADQYAPFVGDDIAPDVVAEPTEAEIAPAMENDIPTQNIAPSEATEPTTANERLAKKLENYENELAKNQQLREQSAIDYDNEIARLQAEYDAKKNKRSLSAHDLLRRIERVKRMKNNVDADYAKRISDLGARIEKLSTKDAKTAAQRQTKMEQHTEKWKNMIGDTSTWKDMALGLSYKTKTLRRILRKVVRGADGKADIALADRIYDELETKYDHNEALLKRESQKVKAVFEKLNLNHAEDTYAHMLGELRHNPETTLTPDVVNDYYNKHKSRINSVKVERAIAEARSTFDSLLVRVNNALREQGFKEIPYRKGYFPHFTNPKQGWLAKLLNWKTIDTEVPTSIAGLTETFTPQRSWQSFNKERKGDATDYSLYQGLDTYIHGALDWIYHIDDLQSRRALENHIRYVHSEEGVKARIDEIKANEEYDADEAQVLIDGVLKEAENPLSGLVRELMNRTNTLANKKSSMDRGMEDATNRKVYSVMTNLNNRINANMVVGSFSSALTNFIPMVQSWHQVSPYFTVRGLGDMIRSTVRDDGMIAKSDFLTNRLIEEEKLYQTGWDKVTDKAALMMNVIDNITSQTVWRSKYLQNIKEGMSESQAIKDADQFAKNLIAGRSRGNAPTIFDAKNPLVKIATAFQLEVANQYGYMFEDVPQDSKNKARLVKGYATAFMGSYLYNALYSSLVGRDAAFDPISIFEDLFKDLGFGDDDEEEPEDIVLNLVDNILDEVPYVGGLVGGGRIPISSALPYEGDYKSFIEDAFNGEVKAKEMLKPLYYLAMPVGGGQIKKTVEGLSMFDDDLPVVGSYTDSGALRFPVEDTLGNRIQAGMFGQYASQNAREYFDKGYAPMQEKQIQEYIDVDIPIRDYWEYREGLKGLDKAQEKVDYIYGLDLPIGKKNILVNNQLNRKEKVDLTEYGEYDNLEEFDFAKDNPEKYDFFTSIGVTYQDYKNADEKGKGVYNWAYENPEKYTVSKAVTGDLFKYKQYTSDLYEIRADKDSKGKTINGSAKEKKIAYINDLDIDYGAKLILFKDAYPADDTYNYEIIEYLNSRDDFTYEDRIAILKELGFTVTADGTAKWD